jgi:branched-chain amino acid transport system substrate-binding protein
VYGYLSGLRPRRGPRAAFRRSFPGLALIAAVALLAACSSSSSNAGSTGSSGSTGVVKLGAIFNETGALSLFEAPAVDGLKYAVSQINAHGFVVDGKRYKLDLVIGPDAAGNASTAAADARSMINDDGIQFLYGPVSEGDEAILPISNASNVLLLTASTAIYSDLGPQNPLLFRVSVDDTWRGQLDEAWLKNAAPDVKTVAFLEINNAEGQEVLQTEMSEFKSAGITPVYTALYPPGTVDFTSYLTKMAAKHPGIFVASVATPDNLTMLREGIQLNVSSNYEVDLTPSQIPTYVPSSFKGKIFIIQTGPQFDIPTTPAAKNYINGLKSFMGGSLPQYDQYSDYYYDSTFMLLKAMQAAKSVTDVKAIADEFSKITYKGMYGTLSYHGGHKLDYPVDNCIYGAGTYTCQNQNLTASGQLQILGSASEPIK